jgi:fatty acid desaturase
MRTTRVNFRWNLLNLLLFLPTVTPGILRGNALYRKQVGKAAKLWRQQLLIESVCVWGIKLAVLAIDWKRGLLLVFLPHVLANWGIVSVNYLQHDGCDETHPVNHSRNFVGRLFNYFTFNNGFHGAHHLTPGLHWSLLPAYHATHFSPTIHPSLEQRSLFLYLFKAFIWPGKRVTFDGKPVEVKAMADRDWVRGDEPTSPDNFVAA